MPELPEVETVRRQLAPELEGTAIVSASAHPSSKFNSAPHAVGSRVVQVRRRGKYLIVDLEDPDELPLELIVHLGMTGQLSVARGGFDGDPYVRARWSLDDGRALVFRDVRRFGRIAVTTPGVYDDMPTLRALGPEPDDPTLTPRRFHRNLAASSRAVKTKLLSQRPIAGVGNIYADEALWLAAINPISTRLSVERAGRLLEAIRTVLTAGIDNGGTTLRDYRQPSGDTGSNQHALRCYGRADEPCERCGDPLRRRIIDARSTTYCGRCQRT